MSFKLLAGLVVLCCFGVTSVNATVIANTFGPGNSFNSTTTAIVGANIPTFADQAVGVPFTLPWGGIVTEVSVAINAPVGSLVDISIPPDLITVQGESVRLYIEAALGNLPGGLGSALSFLGEFSGIGLRDIPMNLVLAAGDYWLVMTQGVDQFGNAGGFAGWNINSIGALGRARSLDGGDTWVYFNDRTSPAFRVEASQIPEPPTAALFLAALFAATVASIGQHLRLRRERRCQ